MGRWEPDARGRMSVAALTLYAEQGFEQTTVAQIAERAGVTERTFFRHFSDKREVLFGGAEQREAEIARRIAAAPETEGALDVVVDALTEIFSDLDLHWARRRTAVVSAHPGLTERELLKMASLSASAASALRERGVAEPSASLAAESGVAVFKAGFETWIASGGSLAERMQEALAALRASVL